MINIINFILHILYTLPKLKKKKKISMQCLQKERKGSKCEAQNMPGEASVILSF